MKTKFDKRLGDPAKWSDEKRAAVESFKRSYGHYPTREVSVCLGCGQLAPCKSDCPAGSGMALES
jgi:hypothetical protein